MVKLVDRHLGKASMQGVLLVWFGLTVLFALFSLLQEMRAVQNQYTASDVIWVIMLTLPQMAYQIFPIAALLGALVGVGGLAASNELVVFRTSGVSRLRLSAGALAGVMILTVPAIVIGEWVAPPAEHQARAFRLSEIVGRAIIGGPRGVWMRDGTDIVNIQLPLLSANRGELSIAFNDVVIYSFTDQVDLKSITRAASAVHSGENWTLNDVSEVVFAQDSASVHKVAQRSWATEVKPEILDAAVTRPQHLSLRALAGYLDYLKENGLDDTVYRAAFWERLVFPLTVIALVLAGMPFVFGSARSHTTGVHLFFGMILGGVFMVINGMAENFGEAYAVPAVWSHVLPSLILAIAAIVALRRTV